MPAMPPCCTSHSNGAPSASRMRVTALVISGPIPSPGIKVAGIFPDIVTSPLSGYRFEIGASSRRKLPQHVGQDAAVSEIVELIERIDAAGQRDLLHRTIRHHDVDRHALARRDVGET